MPFELSTEMSAPNLLKNADRILGIITKGGKSKAKNVHIFPYQLLLPHNFSTD